MPAERDLFNLIIYSTFTEATNFLRAQEQNPDFDINALERNETFLQCALRLGNGTKAHAAFIEEVLSHPRFEHAMRPSTSLQRTPFARALFSAVPNLDVLSAFVRHKTEKQIDVLFLKKDELFAVQLKKNIKRNEEKLAGSEPDELDLKMNAAQKKAFQFMKELTVREALSKDEPDWLQQLVDAGEDLFLPVVANKSIFSLYNEYKGPKVAVWLDGYHNAVKDNPLYQQQLKKEQQQCVDEDYAADESELLQNSMHQARATVARFFVRPTANNNSASSSAPNPANPGNK